MNSKFLPSLFFLSEYDISVKSVFTCLLVPVHLAGFGKRAGLGMAGGSVSHLKKAKIIP
jgi:hypothetical protein